MCELPLMFLFIFNKFPDSTCYLYHYYGCILKWILPCKIILEFPIPIMYFNLSTCRIAASVRVQLLTVSEQAKSDSPLTHGMIVVVFHERSNESQKLSRISSTRDRTGVFFPLCGMVFWNGDFSSAVVVFHCCVDACFMNL